ncbi:uncharacterized protein M6B38_142600 [Iris pallida]|uniref:Protein kinase domain-containing protein n=1 Tax=Iris pallida TaxID=29817 RepID=A0AAX6FBW1_IRIPA|nr:uncharacterized protein M6B38_142600 [Iris pallida]
MDPDNSNSSPNCTDPDAHSKPEEEEEEEKIEPDAPDETVLDVSNKSCGLSLFQSPPPPADSLYIYRNSFHLVPSAACRFETLRTLKFFANDTKILPPDAAGLAHLERLQVKFSRAAVAGFPLGKLESLRELEICKVPSRPSAFSMLGDIAGLKCLTKLSVCYFSIRYLPPEIGCLKKLEELDLSFNKLKSLPDDIAKLTALKSLRVANNKLVHLPPGISSLSSLEKLDLSNNRLTSIASLKLASMHSLRSLNLQYNKLLRSCQIPPWINCDLQGNEGTLGDEISGSILEVTVSDVAVHRAHGNHLYNGASLSCRCTTRRKRRGWKRRDNMQQWARQECLNYSRKYRVEDHSDTTTMKMHEENDSDTPIVSENGQSVLQGDVDEEKQSNCCAIDDISSTFEGDRADFDKDSLSISQKCIDNEKVGSTNMACGDEISCTTELSSSKKHHGHDNEKESSDSLVSPSNELDVPDGNSSSEEAKLILKSKRHYDRDLDNPKPCKFRKPVDECSFLSSKYSTESFCSTDDHLPDGFYDAGRDRPFMSLQDYEQSLCLDSREVILLDREKDEELDAIATSAQILLSSFRRPCSRGNEEDEFDNLQRASVLALFVSDCFGGCDRSSLVTRMRKAIVGSDTQQPFICTCSAGNIYGNIYTSKPPYGIVGNLNFNDLCESSLRLIKETRNSNVVPIGTLRFGVCRHRSVLMKYLCDRAKPPIPCELVRGYLDFMPHAWNAVLVKKGNLRVRMVVDACCPTDIREETDLEYYCRYIPLSRVHVPLTTDISPYECPFSFSSFSHATEDTKSRFVSHRKIGALDVAVKVRNLQACKASQEDIGNFEYTFLGEVRILGALRKHSCIVEIFGHHLSSKWSAPADGVNESRLLQSMIVMEYVKGGTLKDYLNKLSERGEKHAPLDIALCVAKDVACALIELHSKHIIHRDIKSENILIDLDSKRKDGTPVVKLADFDRSVPLHSSTHTCCIAHLGVHPPDVCVGTPRWMAPEVVQAMHQRKPYGLEVDIWSYGCLLLELLTLQVPYKGKSESQICRLLQMQQRASLTPELEAVALFDQAEAAPEANMSSTGDVGTLKFLVDLFYKCTAGNPTDRPTARKIYSDICAIAQQQRQQQQLVIAPTSSSN